MAEVKGEYEVRFLSPPVRKEKKGKEEAEEKRDPSRRWGTTPDQRTNGRSRWDRRGGAGAVATSGTEPCGGGGRDGGRGGGEAGAQAGLGRAWPEFERKEMRIRSDYKLIRELYSAV
ncbi:hypothetical protein R5R35_013501 [Gryllus longicercus]|uniref:Uncharacterized protein n=1 Tax=Gryllus longicercus TaxID=2509291 RepID=A0AAN9V6C0_9ORTH